MSATVHQSRAASMGRMALVGIAAFLAMLMAGALALWAKLGTAVFFEVVAAGIAYCF